MAKLSVKPGTTSLTVYVVIDDAASSGGAGLTGLAFNAAGLTAYYVRVGGTATAITLATQTVAGAWSSGGFVQVDATNMPGWYRLDIPNAVVATGSRSAGVQLKGAANMVPLNLEIDLNSEVNVTHEMAAELTVGEYTLAAADGSAGTLTLPATDAAGNSVPNNGKLAFCQYRVVSGTGIGMKVDVGRAHASDARKYHLMAGSYGTTASDLDTTSVLVFNGSLAANLKAVSDDEGTGDNLETVFGTAAAAAAFRRGVDAIVVGTVGNGSTTTSIVTSSMTPSAVRTDQFKGQILQFARDTTTANLRGQKTDITGNSNVGVLAVTALTDAPVTTDTFSIS